ncbi:IclR family transcriptional regulator [Synergistales bacterium]|nr:IclR family transcriptional regulator [Synergistales bacterium]
MIQSVDRALRILELFVSDNKLSLTEISHRMELSKSTVFGLLETLKSRRYLDRDAMSGKYTLGAVLLKLGGLYKGRLDFRRIAYPIMLRLCEITNQVLQLAVLSGIEVVYLEKVENPNQRILQMVLPVGSTMPAHCTATGKMLLSSLKDFEIETLYHGYELKAYSSNTITDIDVLKNELKKVREQAYAIDKFESNEHVVGVAMPIYDFEGVMVAALSLGGVKGIYPEDNMDQMIELLRDATNEISSGLGFRIA